MLASSVHRIGHLWALALLNDRFDTLLLPVLATSTEVLDALEMEIVQVAWGCRATIFGSGWSRAPACC